jgi:hypothetical protein
MGDKLTILLPSMHFVKNNMFGAGAVRLIFGLREKKGLKVYVLEGTTRGNHHRDGNTIIEKVRHAGDVVDFVKAGLVASRCRLDLHSASP